MKATKFFKVLIISFISLSVWANANNEIDSLTMRLDSYSDSIKLLNSRINTIEQKLVKQDIIYESNQKALKFATEQADSRVAWTISTIEIAIAIVLLIGGWFTYFFTYKPAHEILKDFDNKVEQKFLEKEERDVFKRIELAFSYLNKNNNHVHDNAKLIFDGIPRPVKSIYREEIFKRYLIGNIDSLNIKGLFNIFENIFFQENDSINDQFALYLLNNNNVYRLINNNGIQGSTIVHKYFIEHYKDSKKLTDLFLPYYIKPEISPWNCAFLANKKFDEFFKEIENKRNLLDDTRKYFNEFLNIENPKESETVILGWFNNDSEKKNSYFYRKLEELLGIVVSEFDKS